MRIEDIPFIQELSPARRRRVLALGVLLWAVLLLMGWLALSGIAARSQERIAATGREMERAAGLAGQVMHLEAQLAALSGLAPLAAAQQVVRDLGMEARLTAIRPTQLGGGMEGVQMIFESLDLPQIINLLKQLRSRGGLSTVSATLSRRLDARDRADMQLVVVR
ncbi:MAG: hypothetical protein AB1916_13070 [Thermodesulfobacteriota bacterium]